MFESNLNLDNLGIGNSHVHSIHPAAKVSIAIVAIIINSLFSTIIISLCISIIFTLLIVLAGTSLKSFLKAYAFILFMVVGLIISYFFIIGLTLQSSITVWLNLSALGLPVMFLMFTSPILNTLYGIEFILTPLKKLKIPVNAIVLISTIALNFIPIVITEMQRILSAMAVRGRDIRYAPYIEKIKIFMIALVPLLISTLSSTETLASAIAVKNYDAWSPRTNILHEKWKIGDTAIILTMFILIIIAYIVLK